MFDFSFAELMVICVVALVVIGPERLPKVARTAGHMWGRIQRYVQNVKSEISNDMAMEEARKIHMNVRNDIGAVRQAVEEAGLTAEQQMLQSKWARPEQSADATVTEPAKTDSRA